VYHAYASEMHNLISPLVFQRAQVAPALNRDRSHCLRQTTAWGQFKGLLRDM